jgi:hypothetical protein
MVRRAIGAATTALVILGCRSGPEPVAFANRVFYQYDDPNADISAFEQPYPPLDLAATVPFPEYKGVTLLGGAVHLSRPQNWVLVTASLRPTERFVQYVSPNEYLFSIYERVDSPEDLWREVMGRYEDDTKAAGGQILGDRVPIATWNAQGRAYVVRRTIKAAKHPFVGTAREFLARSDHRIVLVQIAHQTDTVRPVAGELYRVIQTLELN